MIAGYRFSVNPRDLIAAATLWRFYPVVRGNAFRSTLTRGLAHFGGEGRVVNGRSAAGQAAIRISRANALAIIIAAVARVDANR